MNTNKFSFSRFASFFRWFANISIRHIILLLTVIAAVSIVAGLVSTWSHYDSDGRIYAIILFVASGVAGSMCLSSIDKQTIRQQFISIPSTYLEKYLAIVTLQIIIQAVILGIIAVADGIWANSPGFMTFLEPFSLIGYWIVNMLIGFSVRKFPYIYGMICGGGFYIGIIREIKSLLGGEDVVLSFGTTSIESMIFATILLVGCLWASYFLIFKKIGYNTTYWQTFQYNAI